MYDHSFLCMLKTDRKSTKAQFGWGDFKRDGKGKKENKREKPTEILSLQFGEIRGAKIGEARGFGENIKTNPLTYCVLTLLFFFFAHKKPISPIWRDLRSENRGEGLLKIIKTNPPTYCALLLPLFFFWVESSSDFYFCLSMCFLNKKSSGFFKICQHVF